MGRFMLLLSKKENFHGYHVIVMACIKWTKFGNYNFILLIDKQILVQFEKYH